jgi:nucleotide-binding universal stress UspA family protein
MTAYARERVIVGVDSPYRNHPEVELAVQEARRLNAGLTIMHVFVEPTAYGLGPWLPGLTDVVVEARTALDKMAEQVALDHPGVDVMPALVVGSASHVLISASREAKLIVLGCRGLGGFAELMLGSTSSQVASHAHCPVIVVRPPDTLSADNGGPVLLGVDGSPAGEAAVAFAFATADSRRARLIALNVWSSPLADVVDRDDTAEQAARILVSEVLAGWREKHPDVVVEERVIAHPNPEQALVDASANADLVVVGSRGRGGFAGLTLGSVSQALLHHGHCPIAVVRP